MSEVKGLTVDQINEQIKLLKHRGEIFDGYHTFNELYDHRIALFIALLNVIESTGYLKERYKVKKVWKSWNHSDGTSFDGWFIAGMETQEGQITYHLPGIMFHKLEVPSLDNAPTYDGHTSGDVLERLSIIFQPA